MLDSIKKKIYESFGAEEKKGVFFSGFTKEKTLKFSQGIVVTTEPLSTTLDSLYGSYVEESLSTITYISCDVVTDIIEISDTNDLPTFSPEEFGFTILDLDDDKSGVILPNTKGASDVQSILYDLKQKYGIHGKAEIYAFRTQRFLFAT